MVWAAVVIRRIPMTRQNNFGLQLCHARDGRVEIVNLKPEQDAIAVRKFWIADAAVVMRKVPSVQLQDEPVA